MSWPCDGLGGAEGPNLRQVHSTELKKDFDRTKWNTSTDCTQGVMVKMEQEDTRSRERLSG